jgi:hypothetical protein
MGERQIIDVPEERSTILSKLVILGGFCSFVGLGFTKPLSGLSLVSTHSPDPTTVMGMRIPQLFFFESSALTILEICCRDFPTVPGKVFNR